jgi:hypothetical protein
MNPPYFRPAAIVQQEYVTLASGGITPQNTCIIGPLVKTLDPLDAEDRLLINFGAYNPDEDTEYSYRSLPVGARVKLNTVAVRMEDVLAKYATLSGSNVIERGSQANIITIPSGNGLRNFKNAAGTSFVRNSVFKQRDVQIGDRVKITAGDYSLTTRITGFVNEKLDAVVGTPSASANPATRSLNVSIVETDDKGTDHAVAAGSATTYKGDISKGIINDVYVLECIVAGAPTTAKFKVTSDTGDNVASVDSVAFGTEFNVGTRGLRVRITSTGSQAFIVGEKYTITAVAAYTRGAPSLISASSEYSGPFDTVYQIKVVKGGLWTEKPQVVVTTSTGIDASGAITVDYNTSFAVGRYGLTLKFENEFTSTQKGLVLGDTYTVAASASTLGAVRSAILANPISSTISAGDDLSVDFFIYKKAIDLPQSGYPEFASTTVVPAEQAFTVSQGIQIQDPTWLENDGVTLGNLDVKEAKLFVGYSALLTHQVGSLKSISDLSSVSAVLGRVRKDNPLAMGVYKALQNSAGQTVFFVSVPSDDLEGYSSALEVLETDPRPYFRVPMTEDESILDLVAAHISAESADEKGHRCLGIVSAQIPTSQVLYGKKENGDNWTGYVAIEPGSSPAIYTRVTVPGAEFIEDGIRAGDQLRTSFGADALGNETFSSALIDQVIDAENLVLRTPGFSNAVGSSGSLQRIQIVRSLTKDEQASLAKAKSEAFASRRMATVFCDIPMDMPDYFMAAAISGLASSVVPHQPITNYTVNGFNDQVATHRKFTQTQLDHIASGGTLIVTQDAAEGQVYVRHQLTTDRRDDRHAELSVTRNVDSVSEFLRQGLATLSGKYNQSEHFLQLVDVQLRSRLDLLVSTRVTETAGPQINSWDPKSLIIVQNPVARTQVDLEVEADFPLPANRLKLKLRVAG